jgi:hypothetical protein
MAQLAEEKEHMEEQFKKDLLAHAHALAAANDRDGLQEFSQVVKAFDHMQMI